DPASWFELSEILQFGQDGLMRRCRKHGAIGFDQTTHAVWYAGRIASDRHARGGSCMHVELREILDQQLLLLRNRILLVCLGRRGSATTQLQDGDDRGDTEYQDGHGNPGCSLAALVPTLRREGAAMQCASEHAI